MNLHNLKNNKTHNRIKLCHIVTNLNTGGMENGIINLCNRHNREKFELTICCLKSFGNMSKRLKDDVKLICMNFKDGKPIFDFLKMAKFLKKYSFDIVHTHGLAGGSYVGIIGARLAGISSIINGEHGAFYLKPHQIILQKFLGNICDLTLSVSFSLKERIIQNLGLPSDKIMVIPNGVDTNIFSGNYDYQSFSKEIKSKYNISVGGQNIVIGCIASLKPEKNQMMLLKALIEIKRKKKIKDLQILFVGDGPDHAKLKRFVKESGIINNVTFLGIRDDIPQLLSVMDIFVSTSISHHEGMSNVVLEAMSSGLPVIATRSVGTSELVKDCCTGFIVDQDDISALAEKIILMKCDTNLRKKMGKNAHNMIEHSYSITKMVSKYENLYLNLMKS